MKTSKIALVMVTLLLAASMLTNLVGCTTPAKAHSHDLMDGVEAQKVERKEADNSFISSQMQLAVKLFKAANSETSDKNVLVSPLSIQLALAMTANGANGQTEEEMQALLGGDIPLDELNEYLYAYVSSLPSAEKYKLGIANSIWFRDDDSLTVNDEFLQTNANYYNAQAYKSPFDSPETVADINNWVNTHTDGMIDKIIDEIDPSTVMHLINAIVFDAEWQVPYEKSDVYDGKFTSINGEEQTVKMMSSLEWKYIENENVIGFIKDYKERHYSFAAILPNEDIALADYVAGLTPEELTALLENVQESSVIATMPKFSYEYELEMKDLLISLGMPSAFSSGADFSRLGHCIDGNIYIGSVFHKTFISVDERGTKAAAVTDVVMKAEGALITEKIVRLDRPFVYMIIDNATNLPIFIGTVTDLK